VVFGGSPKTYKKTRSKAKDKKMFKPEYAVVAAIGVCLLMGLLLVNNPGNHMTGTALVLAQPGGQAASAGSVQAQAPIAKATLDLAQLAKTNNIDEADNARWALVRDTPGGAPLYSAATGVDWKTLRTLTQAGTILVPAGSSWSFNQAYQEGVGYKNASGVLAGGLCSLATVLRVAASRAGLVTEALPHKYPIPGFALAETVNIWWGRDDLVVRNPTPRTLSLAWILTPQTLTVSVIPAPVSPAP
jgi:hypothetical protein